RCDAVCIILRERMVNDHTVARCSSSDWTIFIASARWVSGLIFVAIAVGCLGRRGGARACSRHDFGAGTVRPNLTSPNSTSDAILIDALEDVAEGRNGAGRCYACSAESGEALRRHGVPPDQHDSLGKRCPCSRQMVRDLRAVGQSDTVAGGAHGEVLAVFGVLHC